MGHGDQLSGDGLTIGGDNVKPHQLKCAVVSRMYRDGIMVGRKVADIDTVAEQAVPPAHHAAAEREIREYMIRNDDCPVVMVSSDVIALRPDEDRIVEYLERYCESAEEWPPGLREGL